MCNLQAILGLEVLPLLDDIISSCIKKSDYLAGALNKAHIGFQHVPHGARPSYFKYAIRMPDRKRILDFLFRQGIDVTFGYMQACSNLRNLAKFSKGCPESFLLDAEHLYLPIHSCHSVADMDYIVRTLVCARERLPL
jgi:dTDP-4-amino-4,6-dideoxygalactose transaminase